MWEAAWSVDFWNVETAQAEFLRCIVFIFVASINKNDPTKLHCKLKRSNERTNCEGISHRPVLYLFLNLVCHWMGITVTSFVQQNGLLDSAVCFCGNALNFSNYYATQWISGHLNTNKNLTLVFFPSLLISIWNLKLSLNMMEDSNCSPCIFIVGRGEGYAKNPNRRRCQFSAIFWNAILVYGRREERLTGSGKSCWHSLAA